jgi:hypothetical protein
MSVQVMSPGYGDLTQEFLQSVLDYDPSTGYFTWKDTRYSRKSVRVGSRAEHIMIEKTGHLAIDLFPLSFSAARLAILYTTGDKVSKPPVHLNGNNADNSIKNLKWKDGEIKSVRGVARTFKIPFNTRHIPIFDNEIEYVYELLGRFIQEHGKWDGSFWAKST